MFCQICGERTEPREHEGKIRPVCIRCGAVCFLDPKLAAGVLIERGGRLLFGRRGPGAREAGKWSFPAGFVERGEQVEDAAIRETREEVGLVVTLGRLLGLFSETGETVVLAVFVAATIEGDPLPGDDIEAVGWFAPDDLPELAFGRDRAIVDLWEIAMNRD